MTNAAHLIQVRANGYGQSWRQALRLGRGSRHHRSQHCGHGGRHRQGYARVNLWPLRRLERRGVPVVGMRWATPGGDEMERVGFVEKRNSKHQFLWDLVSA